MWALAFGFIVCLVVAYVMIYWFLGTGNSGASTAFLQRVTSATTLEGIPNAQLFDRNDNVLNSTASIGEYGFNFTSPFVNEPPAPACLKPYVPKQYANYTGPLLVYIWITNDSGFAYNYYNYMLSLFNGSRLVAARATNVTASHGVLGANSTVYGATFWCARSYTVIFAEGNYVVRVGTYGNRNHFNDSYVMGLGRRIYELINTTQ
jgi:hypothetical protein